MAGFGWNAADAFADNTADRFVNNFIPGNGMFFFFKKYDNIHNLFIKVFFKRVLINGSIMISIVI